MITGFITRPKASQATAIVCCPLNQLLGRAEAIGLSLSDVYMDHRRKTKDQLIAELEAAERLIAKFRAKENADHPPHSVVAAKTSRKASGDTAQRPPSPQEPDELPVKSEERYRSFIDQCAEGIWLVE